MITALDLMRMSEADRAAHLAGRVRALDARIKAVHDRAHPECGRWEAFQKAIFVGRKRTPDMLDGFGCPDHHVWIEGQMAR